MTDNPLCDGPIDVVIAWVDGNDPEHRAKRLACAPQARASHSDAAQDTRFIASDEIYFAIASVLKYAPFIRTIWLVTDNQKPQHLDLFAKSGLCAQDKIQVVDHTEILGDIAGALPTFSSLTIEAAVWRIDGLANRYIYMNDDFMFLKPVTETDFFIGTRPTLRGRIVRSDHRRPFAKVKRLARRLLSLKRQLPPSFRVSQELGARIAGHTDEYIRVGHWPHPQLRDVQANFHERNPDVLPRQTRDRFRTIDQYNAVSLTNHLMTPQTLLPYPPMAYLRPMADRKLDKVIDNFTNDSCLFGCMQSLEKIPPQKRETLLRGLAARLGRFLPIDP